MKIKNVVFFFLISSLFLSNIPLDRIQKKIDKEIKSTFKIENYTIKLLSISDSISKLLPVLFNNNFKKIYSNKILVGYSYYSKAPSLYNLFDYLIILDADLKIKKSKILTYREDYGGEIASKRWLRQFIGKSWTDKFIYSKDVSAISGATISVKSMINAVESFMSSIKILDKKNIIR
jgi:Na+-translocating ferredoxin:NAD+ oxidoreductase RnfG subunit